MCRPPGRSPRNEPSIVQKCPQAALVSSREREAGCPCPLPLAQRLTLSNGPLPSSHLQTFAAQLLPNNTHAQHTCPALGALPYTILFTHAPCLTIHAAPAPLRAMPCHAAHAAAAPTVPGYLATIRFVSMCQMCCCNVFCRRKSAGPARQRAGSAVHYCDNKGSTRGPIWAGCGQHPSPWRPGTSAARCSKPRATHCQTRLARPVESHARPASPPRAVLRQAMVIPW
jgi:hypothetical protein